MAIAAKTEDVTKFLKDIISNVMMSTTDKGQICSLAGSPVKRGTPAKPIYVYQRELPDEDILIFNPFSEGVTPSDSFKMFNYMVRRSLYVRLLAGMRLVVAQAVFDKSLLSMKPAAAKKAREEHPDPGSEVTRLTSLIVESVDDKTMAEFDTFHGISTDEKNFDTTLLAVHYARQTLSARLDVPVLNYTYGDKDGDYVLPTTIRKKTVVAFQKLIMGILGIKTPEEIENFRCEAIDGATPRIDSILRVFFKVMRQLNPLMLAMEDDVNEALPIDLEQLDMHLSRMPEYTLNARSAIHLPREADASPTTTPSAVSTAAAPTAPNVVHTDGIRIPTSIGADGQPRYDNNPSRPASTMHLTGYQGQPVPMVNNGGWQAPMGQQPMAHSQPYGQSFSQPLPPGGMFPNRGWR